MTMTLVSFVNSAFRAILLRYSLSLTLSLGVPLSATLLRAFATSS